MPPFSSPSTPFAVPQRTFRFGALASAAERLRAGGERETLMALFMVARLIDDRYSAPLSIAGGAVDRESIDDRSQEMRQWLSSLPLPGSVSDACVRCVQAWAAHDRPSLSTEWQALVAAAGQLLDAATLGDVEAVSTLLG